MQRIINLLYVLIMEVFFWIFVVVFFVVSFMFFIGILRIREHIDEVYHNIFKQHEVIVHQKERLDAHHKDIVNLSKQHDKLEEKVDEYHKGVNTDFLVGEQPELEDTKLVIYQTKEVVELQERRDKFATYRKQGMDIKSAGAAIGVSYSTAKRYEKWIIDNKK